MANIVDATNLADKSINLLQDVDTITTPPVGGDIVKYDGLSWQTDQETQLITTNRETLVALTKTMIVGDAVIQELDPNGDSRFLVLPDPPVAGMIYRIKNLDPNYCIFIREAALGAPIIDLSFKSGSAEVVLVHDGTEWHGIAPTPVFSPPNTNVARVDNSGVVSYITVVNSIYATGSNFSYEFWYRPTAVANFDDLLSVGKPSGAWEATRLSINTTTPRLELQITNSSDTREFINPGQFSAAFVNNWNHVAVTFEPNLAKIYVNGCLYHQFNSAFAALKGVDELVLGTRADNVSGANRLPGGDFAQVRWWNITRTAEEIAANFDKALTTSTTLVVNLPLDGNFTDLTGNSASVTPTGTVTFVGV